MRSAAAAATPHEGATSVGVGGGGDGPVQFPVTFRSSGAYLVTKLKLYATFGIYFQVGRLVFMSRCVLCVGGTLFGLLVCARAAVVAKAEAEWSDRACAEFVATRWVFRAGGCFSWFSMTCSSSINQSIAYNYASIAFVAELR